MIPRYSPADMAALWSDEARLSRWLEVEILAVEGWAAAGVVPATDAEFVRANAPVIDAEFVRACDEREAVTDHDVAAFVDVAQARMGGTASTWVHYGLTSSDVVDTALSAGLVASCDLMLAAMNELVESLRRRAVEFRGTPTIGRTHGVHAEPTTFGAKLALWCLQADRDRTRLQRARTAMAVGKLSGAVGTYSNIDPSVETYVCSRLGLQAVPSTQVIARDRHAEFLAVCASIGASIECFALEVRHLQRTEVREAAEGFRPGQKGSSAMPHKRNPITSERLCGIARMLRGYVIAGYENVALWHERDISHSSVERVVLPDASNLTLYAIRLMTRLIDRLDVWPDRMLANLESSYGLVFSQPVLLALIDSGYSRDDAYRIVQDNALNAWAQSVSFRSLLDADERVTVAPEVLDAAFDLQRSLRHAGRIFDSLDAVPAL